MEKKRFSNPDNTKFKLQESFYEILKEISQIRPQTTFTKEQEEEFLKDAIVIFEYLKAGIDINSSEILINNGEMPFSCLEKILINFSEHTAKDNSKAFTYHLYLSDKLQPVKIYEFQKCEEIDHEGNSDKLLENKNVSWKRNILFIKSESSTKRNPITKYQLKKIIDYALKNDVVLLYDATSSKESNCVGNVKSIYEIENAKSVAIEFKRFSSADSDKLTCGYLVVPEGLKFPLSYNETTFSKIKDLLKEEIKKGNISRKSLENSFLNYACL